MSYASFGDFDDVRGRRRGLELQQRLARQLVRVIGHVFRIVRLDLGDAGVMHGGDHGNWHIGEELTNNRRVPESVTRHSGVEADFRDDGGEGLPIGPINQEFRPLDASGVAGWFRVLAVLAVGPR
jgi:hypothetical protein